MISRWSSLVCVLLSLCITTIAKAGTVGPVPLWPGTPPGEKRDLGPEKDTTKPTDDKVAGKPLIRLGNVSTPDITIYTPPADKITGAAVLVCPGGGYYILAMDLEGTEICEWLNSIGVTGVLLKYRVPKRQGEDKPIAPLQDAERAMGIVRQRASEWGINPKKIGVMGFSAGGHLAGLLSNVDGERNYPKQDAADELSCHPDFAILVYPAYLTSKENNDALSPGMNVNSNTAPTFIAMSQDDPVRVETGLFYGAALQKAHVPFELHIYPTGGHGYGLRRTEKAVTTWPDRAAEWMRSRELVGSLSIEH